MPSMYQTSGWGCDHKYDARPPSRNHTGNKPHFTISHTPSFPGTEATSEPCQLPFSGTCPAALVSDVWPCGRAFMFGSQGTHQNGTTCPKQPWTRSFQNRCSRSERTKCQHHAHSPQAGKLLLLPPSKEGTSSSPWASTVEPRRLQKEMRGALDLLAPSPPPTPPGTEKSKQESILTGSLSKKNQVREMPGLV